MNPYFQRFHKVKYNLLRENPFFGELLLSLRFGLASCGTCFTDMRHIVFDPIFMDTLTDLEVEMCVLHELMHCVLNHCVRSHGKIQSIYNIACDIVVNSFVYGTYYKDTIGDVKLIYQYKGKPGSKWSAEEIYEDLLRERSVSSDILDHHEMWQDVDEEEKEFQWYLKKAKKYCGDSIGEHLRQLLNMDYQAGIDWKLLLRDYLNDGLGKEDYSYQKRDTRFFNQPYVLPGLCEQDEYSEINKVLVAVDVSGSVGDSDYLKFCEELKQLQSTLQFKGQIVFFNQKMSQPQSFDSYSTIDFSKVKGYGGTSYEEVFDYMTKEQMKLLLVLTDGYCDFPSKPSFPVIWILTEKIDVPYGKSVVIA